MQDSVVDLCSSLDIDDPVEIEEYVLFTRTGKDLCD